MLVFSPRITEKVGVLAGLTSPKVKIFGKNCLIAKKLDYNKVFTQDFC
ncbi:hypothetical protein O53_3963 [Microcystis aeruginosa TAIHU98]|uniref:Uncharacterized protein n=1 Tax=Microcystis aeruginosa TAIHU98 TaxID=1134457 RepID=L7E7Y9_MICAE|nr:hypothetical protein O53_3963 [Microcystis aeruginosa TAIHU98]